MSTQRGNVSRTRPQKYCNKTKFKNDLHDTSHTIKNINKLEIANICSRCKSVIEWKIKYKKYKQLKNPSTCVSCHNKNVKHAYHTLCTDCATKQKVCPKCGKEKELVVPTKVVSQEELLRCPRVKALMQELAERRRRVVYRLLSNPEENDLCNEEQLVAKLEKLRVNSAESTLSFGSGSDDDGDGDDDDDDLDDFDF